MQLKYCCTLSYGWWTKQNIRALLYRELLKWQTRATLKVARPSHRYLYGPTKLMSFFKFSNAQVG